MDLIRHGMAEIQIQCTHLDLVLQVADSSITYRSRFLTSLKTKFVLDLLLVDETNPRSIAFQLASLAELCDKLPRKDSTNPWSLEKRLALKPLSAVRLCSTDELVYPKALERFLAALHSDLYDLSEAFTGRYLSHVMPSRLISTSSPQPDSSPLHGVAILGTSHQSKASP